MNIPQETIDRLPADVKADFLKWDRFMYDRVKFNMPQSLIHAMGHCERVLLYALIMGHEIFGNDPAALSALAHASVFHDTRRLDDYLDTGHGARAAVYYEEFCRQNHDIDFYPEVVYMMRYHDLDDAVGRKAITKEFGDKAPRALRLYEIFKDADALDRWRLGRHGLDPRYLRTPQSRRLTDYARQLVIATMPPSLLSLIESEVDRTLPQ